MGFDDDPRLITTPDAADEQTATSGRILPTGRDTRTIAVVDPDGTVHTRAGC